MLRSKRETGSQSGSLTDGPGKLSPGVGSGVRARGRLLAFLKLTCRTAFKLATLEISGSTQLGPNPVAASRSLSSIHTGLKLAKKLGQPEQKGEAVGR